MIILIYLHDREQAFVRQHRQIHRNVGIPHLLELEQLALVHVV